MLLSSLRLKSLAQAKVFKEKTNMPVIYKEYFSNDEINLFTICVFTSEQHTRLRLLIKYYEALKLNVIVLDASKKSLKTKVGKNIRYIHSPNLDLGSRLILFGSLVQTKYILLSPDDDYFLPHGLGKCLNFLEQNPEYSSVQGLRVTYTDDGQTIWRFSYTQQVGLDFSEEDAISRLKRMSVSMHYIYSIMQLKSYKAIVACLQGTETSSVHAFPRVELVFNYTLAIFGPHKILSALFSARLSHPLREDTKLATFGKWIDSRSRSSLRFRANLTNFYIEHLGLPRPNAVSLENLITNYHRKSSFCRTKKIQAKIVDSNQVEISKWKKLLICGFKGLFISMRKVENINYVSKIVSESNLLIMLKDLSYLSRYLKRKK